jgi:hypothetical protein
VAVWHRGNLARFGCNLTRSAYLTVRAYKVERPVRGEEAVTHMRIVVTNYGGPHALQVFEEGCPEPKDGEVRARVPIAGNIL